MMNSFDKFLHLLEASMPEPTFLGWFHLFCLTIMFGSCFFIYKNKETLNKEKINKILFLIGIALIIGETYKQLINSFNYNDGNPYYEYNWTRFPFQFCSTPIYLIPLAVILKKGKIYDTILCFLATFSVFGGLSVMIYPTNVFGTTIGTNIYTMLLHASMVFVGFTLLISKSVELNYKTIKKGSIIFIIILIIALILNISYHFIGDSSNSFNMFYISPYEKSTFPVLGWMHNKLPYIFILLTYFGVFLLATCVIMFSAKRCLIKSKK
ncbi:MAG: hypothetical protein E7184_04020 [Erysipelotrichaceae bacterium]|nr:hypothetical protein [Erysipelotrichaceae bacterium]